MPADSARKPLLTAEWRDLAVLNFEADPELLLARLPPDTKLDLWRGTALISLVGFRFLDTRVLGAAIPFHRHFDEINLRFYVVGPQGRGVVFIREFVPRRAVTVIANTIYGENYATAIMSHDIRTGSAQSRASYSWRWRGREHCFTVEAAGEPSIAPDGSAEAFIFEHYWGYGRSTYRVEHPRWRTYNVTGARFDIDGEAAYGREFAKAFERGCVSAMLAEGSAITVYRRERA